ncbi:MAG TPA: CvpA family protein [Lacipirellulaceae bacterium]|nr:CvpA family protein [Lacipirellulaceae bacterium]
MYWAIYLIILFAAIAMMVREGLWSNTITLVNIIVSGLAAFGFYSPLVIYLDEMSDGEHTYWLDFAVIWVLFAVVMVVCRVLTAAASKTRMRFKNPIDPVGGPVAAVLAAWTLAAFALATLHMSPMPKDAFGGKLLHDDVESASFVMAPDAAWLRFVEKMSQPVALGSGGTERFSAKDFVKIYEIRREKLEKITSLVVDRS